MFENLGIENYTALQVSVGFALALGLLFGFFAETTKFCFRRAVVGPDRKTAAGVWAIALGVAILSTQAAVFTGLIDFTDHRFLSPDLPVLAILIGGGIFGAGMVLTRGCASRLTVLSATGNIRATFTMILFAIVANATIRGPLAGLRQWISAATYDLGTFATLGIPFGIALAVLLIIFALRSGNRLTILAMAAVIGLLPTLGWIGTGFVLYDEFDPITFESLAFTLPAADGLFWVIASTAVEAKFTTALIAGVLVGAFFAALIGKRLEWVGFDGPRQMGRYALGAILMGFGGVLAGGCTIGAGLSGIPTLSVAALLALVSMAAGARLTNRLLSPIPFSREFGGLGTTLPQQPAE